MDELIVEENNSIVEDSKNTNLIKPLPDETAPRTAEYLGSFPVSGRTPEERASYVGKQLELISKRSPSSLKPVYIAMTLGGVKICDPTMKEIYMAHALRRISYTTCVPVENILAFVSRNPGQSLTNQYCHTFKTDHAAEINSIIGGAFLTAYTLKRRKSKKRLSLEITSPDDPDYDNPIDADTDSITSEQSDHQSPVSSSRPKQKLLKKTISGSSQYSQDASSPSKNRRSIVEDAKSPNTETAGGFSELESRVFAALNEKAQAQDLSETGVVSKRSIKQESESKIEIFDERPLDRTRMLRRPMSYHEPSSRSRRSGSKQYLRDLGQISDALPENSTVDLNISNLRLSDRGCAIDDSDLINRKRSTSLGQGLKNMNNTANMRAREAEMRMRSNLEAQILADTLKSTAGGCTPTKSISDYLPFRFSKKKKEKKKYTRSKTESVLVADKTFGRMWKPQQLNPYDDGQFTQRTEIIPTKSMLSGDSNSPDSRVRLSLAESYRLGSADIIQSEIDSVLGRNRPFEQNNISRRKSPPFVDTLSDLPRQRSSLASGTTCTTATTSSSSCPSSSYLTDATCEDSGMYTQSSKSSSSSNDSCERKSSRSSGSDSLLSRSSTSTTWFPKSTANLDETLAELDSSKSNAGRLRNSLAAQMISADSFVSLDAKLMSAAWYHPGVPIDVAMGILNGEEDGSFLLVRPIRKGASYTLVMSSKGSCKLFNINKMDKVGYHIEGKKQFFPHVYIMIAQYSCHPGPLPYKLKTMQLFNPLCREKLDKK